MLDIEKTPKTIGKSHMKSNFFDEMSNMSMSMSWQKEMWFSHPQKPLNVIMEATIS